MKTSTIATGFGTNPVHTNLTTLGTAPVRVADVLDGKTRHFKITNKHNSQGVAWTLTDRGASAPSITASAAGSLNSDEGAPILPLGYEYVSVEPGKSLWVVGSAASTLCSIVEIRENR